MVNIKIIVDRETGRSKGYGFVSYSEPLGESGRQSDGDGVECACPILLLVGWLDGGQPSTVGSCGAVD